MRKINKLIFDTIQLSVDLLEKLITFQTINYCDKYFCCGQGREVSDSDVAADIGSLQDQSVSSRQNSFGFLQGIHLTGTSLHHQLSASELEESAMEILFASHKSISVQHVPYLPLPALSSVSDGTM